MERATVAYGIAMSAFAWFCTFIAPGVEPMFEFMLISMFLWFITANLRNLKRNVEPSPITRDDLLLCIGVFALIFFTTRATGELLSSDNLLITQTVIIGSIVFYAGKFIKDLNVIGVPIPTQLIDLIEKLAVKNPTQTNPGGNDIDLNKAQPVKVEVDLYSKELKKEDENGGEKNGK